MGSEQLDHSGHPRRYRARVNRLSKRGFCELRGQSSAHVQSTIRDPGASVADDPRLELSPAENLLMVTEKVNAFTEAAATIVAGGTAHHVVKGYRKKVRANVRHLRCWTNDTGFVRVAADALAALASSSRPHLRQEGRCHQRPSFGSSRSYLRGTPVSSRMKVRPHERPIRRGPEHRFG